jgi:hypothetical protein
VRWRWCHLTRGRRADRARGGGAIEEDTHCVEVDEATHIEQRPARKKLAVRLELGRNETCRGCTIAISRN